MDLKEALTNVTVAASSAKLTKNDHLLIEESLKLIRATLDKANAQKEKEKEAQPYPEKPQKK